MKNTNKKQDWRSYFQLLKKSNIPWLLLLGYFLVSLVYSRVTTDMIPFSSKIYTGEIMNMSTIMQYIGYIAMAVVLFGIQLFFQYWFYYKTERQVQALTWKHMLRMPMGKVMGQNVTTLPSRITSDPARLTSQFILAVSVLTSLYSLYNTFVNIGKDSVDMASFMLKMLGVLMVYIVVMGVICGRFTFKATRRFQDSYAALTDYVTERLSNIALIKSAANEDEEMKLADAVINKQYRAQLYYVNVNFICTVLTDCAMYFFQAVTLFVAANMLRNGGLDATGMMTAYRYSLVVPVNVTIVMTFFFNVKEGQGSSATISQIVATEPEKVQRKHSFAMEDADIFFDNVSFGYDQKSVIENASFVIPAHKTTALVGPNGAGKSTVANLLERYYAPTAGKLSFGDCPVEDIHLDEWRQAIGYMQQETVLVTGSLKDNLCYGLNRPVSEEEFRNALKAASLEGFVNKLPMGLDTDLGEMGAKLSSGERQRIGIARMILRDPEYLILDEITSNLDTGSKAAVLDALRDLMAGRTCIVISHDMDIVKKADHIVVLENGKVRSTGNHEVLSGTDTLYKTLCAAAGC